MGKYKSQSLKIQSSFTIPVSVTPKFQLNISKIMPARPKNTGTLVVNATILTAGLDVAITSLYKAYTDTLKD